MLNVFKVARWIASVGKLHVRQRRNSAKKQKKPGRPWKVRCSIFSEADALHVAEAESLQHALMSLGSGELQEPRCLARDIERSIQTSTCIYMSPANSQLLAPSFCIVRCSTFTH